ncbi:VOC family protein [Plantactinospora siamensis]|uniref:VOC family protein n=1 Tax=Plantactinospora siamensis TaxID=555372 RepID=A0ABV6NTL2_9ACTN
MFQELFPIITSPDLDAAVRFYRDLLDCRVTYRFPDDDPEFVALRMGAASLGLAAATAERPAGTAGPRFTLWAYVDDCDAALARLRAAGVPVLVEPADQEWGERMATVADPDGNQVIIAQRRLPSG